MKLDSIVYDYQSFQKAIATELNRESETFKSIYPSDTATSLVNVLASYGSMLQYQLVSAMANAYTDTAYSEAGIYQLAETLGNRLHGNVSSVVYCDIERTTLLGMDNIVIPEGSKFTIGDLNFFNSNTILFPRNTNRLENIQLVQGELKVAEFTSAGESGEKIYFCDDFKCNQNMVHVYVEGEEWDVTDTFLPYVVIEETEAGKADVVILRTDPDGRTYIKFGNNTNGKIASAGSKIRIEYVSNEGAEGNFNTKELDINLSTPLFYDVNGTRVQLFVDIIPTTPASGGYNTQSLDVLRQSSPYVFASGDRAVRRNDYKAMLLNKCGYLTCNVWGEYEEAELQGGYDKIMMNMVYYTGIKSIQKYDLQPIANPSLSLAQINSDPNVKFFPVNSNIYSARGFLGSYIIDIISYSGDNSEVRVKYRDAQGNGVLTCDPSINGTLLLPSTSQTANFSDNFEQQIFNINDFSDFLSDSLNVITTNQDETDNPNTEEVESVAEDLIRGTYKTSSGKNSAGQNVTVNFDNPFQIRFKLSNRESITAFAFKTPKGSLDNFINKFAIYGTNESPNVIGYDNIKNNSKWIKLTGVQSFGGVDLSLDSYTDWVTTNVYSPGTSERKQETFNNQSLREGRTAVVITELTDTENLSYLVKIDGLTQSTNTYEIAWKYNQVEAKDELLLKFNHEIDPATVVLYGTSNTWINYQYYVIEVYSIQDSSQKNPSKIALQQIKAIYKKSSSTIDYTDNNAISLNIPLVNNSVIGTSKTYDLFAEVSDGGTDYTVGDTFTLNGVVLSDGNPLSGTVTTVDDENRVKNISLSTNRDSADLSSLIGTTTQVATNDVVDNPDATGLKIALTIQETKTFGLPYYMEYYLYDIQLNNVTQNNGYGATDVLVFNTTADDGYTYKFRIKIKSITDDQIDKSITIEKSYDPNQTTILRGKSIINLNDVPFTTTDGETVTSGHDGTITIKSISSVNVYGSYTGNYYLDKDIQAIDLPVINKYNHFTTYLEFKQPRIKNIAIEINVEYENVTTYLTTKAKIKDAINAQFELQPYSIGKSLNVSDLWKAVNSVDGISRFNIITPIDNIDCMPYELIVLPAENLVINDIINSEYKK